MRTRSRLILLWVSLMVATLSAACDFVGPLDLCFDPTDTGEPCKTDGGRASVRSYHDVAIFSGAADKGSAALDPNPSLPQSGPVRVFQ